MLACVRPSADARDSSPMIPSLVRQHWASQSRMCGVYASMRTGRHVQGPCCGCPAQAGLASHSNPPDSKSSSKHDAALSTGPEGTTQEGQARVLSASAGLQAVKLFSISAEPLSQRPRGGP